MSFRERLRSGDLVVGTWIKTPHPAVVEVLSTTDLDCLVVDAEHAPFGRHDIDLAVLAARPAAKPILVRVPSGAPEHALQALDCGATGIIVPHVRSVADAEQAVRISHYGNGGRGYAGSTRAAGYTRTPVAEHLQASAASTTVIVQIEDPEAVDAIDDIAAVEGIDALFVGRVDLSVAMGKAIDHPDVIAAVERVCESGQRHGRTVGMFLNRVEDVRHWRDKGASLFLLASDQAFLLSGAAQLLQAAR
jgi:2-keto-3-deoxy-L-rhamnonate aldolase RhmA